MNREEGKLNFSMGLDLSEFQADAERAKQMLRGLGDQAKTLADLIREFEDQGIDMSSTEKQIEAISKAIEANNKEYEDAISAMEQYSAAAQKAFESGDMEAFEQNTAEMIRWGETATDCEQAAATFASALETINPELEDNNEELEKNESLMVKMLGGTENYKTIMENMPAPIQNAAKGIQSMTKAGKAFIATPLGAALAAIVLALKAVQTWMNSTVEGQLRLAEVTGYLSGILGQLKEIVINIGRAFASVGTTIVNAFKNPQEAIKSLAQALKNDIANRLKSIGEMASAVGGIIKSAVTLDWDGMKQGMKNLTDSFLKFGTGVDDAGAKISNWAKGVKDAAAETAAINRETRELEIAVSEWQLKNEELEQKMAEAQGKMFNSSLSTEERRKAKNEYEQLLNEQLSKETEFADKRIELQKRSMALTSNVIEDENTLRDLEAQRAALETKRAQALASLQRREGQWNNKDITALKSETTAEQKRLQALQEIGNMEAELELDNNDKRISAMREGLSKTLEEIEHEKKEEEQKITELEQKFRKNNKTAGVDVGENGLTEAQTQQIEAARKLIEQQYAKDTEDALKEALQSVLTYEQQRTKIQEDYAKQRSELYKRDASGNVTSELRDGVTQGNLDELERQQQESLKAIDEQFASRSDDYKAWCNQVATMSLKQLEKTLEEAKKALQDAEASGASDEELAVARAKVATAQQSLKEQNAKKDAMSPGQRSLQDWKDLYDVLKDCKDAFDEVGEAIGGTVGEMMSAAGEIASITMSMINSIVQFTSTSTEAMKTASEGAAAAIRAVETASVILAAVTAAMQIASKIVSIVKSSQEEKAEKQLKALDKQVDTLQKRYDRLSESIEEAYSTDASKLINQQNELLDQQKRLINQQIAVERSRKNSDEDKIQELIEQYQELDDTIEDNKQKAIDAIFGEDLQSAIEDFADAYADAWTAGEDRSVAVKDTVKSMMRQMVTESIKAAIQAEGSIEAIRTKLQEFYADGVLTDWEQKYVLNMAEEIQKELDEKFAWADSLMKDDSSSSSSRSGTSGGITTASQDTVDELNGRATAIQGHTFSISENTQRLLSTANAILNSVLHIEDHTDDIKDRVTGLETGMKEIRNTVNDISLKGIKIR